MKQVGIVGWRGMVGSVLLQRMIEENDFDDITAHFFSTSSAGAAGPVINGKSDKLKDANSLSALAEMDIIITCQGGDYTKAIYPALINSGWQGYWIDAASALRTRNTRSPFPTGRSGAMRTLPCLSRDTWSSV